MGVFGWTNRQRMTQLDEAQGNSFHIGGERGKDHSLLCGTIRGNFFTTAVSSCIMVSMCSVLWGNHKCQVFHQEIPTTLAEITPIITSCAALFLLNELLC